MPLIGQAGGLITGGPGITGMWPPIGGLTPGAGPTGIIPGGGEAPTWGAGSIPGRGGPGRLGVSGIVASAGGGAENAVGGMVQLFRQAGSEPALPSTPESSRSHSLCVSYHCSGSFSQMESPG